MFERRYQTPKNLKTQKRLRTSRVAGRAIILQPDEQSPRSSPLLCAVLIAALVALSAEARRKRNCTTHGCKYGGICDPDGECSCVFKCEDSWTRNTYCTPKGVSSGCLTRGGGFDLLKRCAWRLPGFGLSWRCLMLLAVEAGRRHVQELVPPSELRLLEASRRADQEGGQQYHGETHV